MREHAYDVVLQTELGPKHGTMFLSIEHGNITGYFSILQKTEPCYGEIDRNGICTLYGQFKTLMSVIPYAAKGYLDSEKIKLTLHSEQDVFEVTGTARPLEGSV